MSNMRTFPIREFRNKESSEWPVMPLERFLCVFEDDVTLEVTTPRLELSALLWGVYEAFPKLGMLSDHYLGNGPVPSSKFEEVLSYMYEGIARLYYQTPGYNKEVVWKQIYRSINDVYNTSVVKYRKYVRGLWAGDYHELYTHPEMVKIRGEMRPTASSIANSHKKAEEFILSDRSPKHNVVVSDSKTGVARLKSLNQIIVCRGFNTDIDDNIYPTPIMGNYYNGILDPAEAVIDSTLASKAYVYQSAPLEKTEYANRKLQFPSARVDLLIESDCGSTKYITIPVTKERAPWLLGMTFVDEETGKLQVFTKKLSKECVGKTLQFRTALLCAWRDTQCVCNVCYGELHHNLPYGTNLGINASTNTQSAVSQLVLEVKHVEALTEPEPLVLTAMEMQFIVGAKDPSYICISKWIKDKRGRLLIKADVKDRVINGSRLPVVTMGQLDPQLSAARHSQFKEMYFEYDINETKKDRVKVGVAKGNMASFLTNEFLRWFIPQQLTPDADGFYRVDLSEWDIETPFLELPAKHVSAKDFSSEVEVFIRSSSDNSSKHLGKMKQLSHYVDINHAAIDLFDLISSRIKVHFSHVSAVCLSMLVDAESRNECKIPPIDRPARYAKFSRVMSQGSFSAMAAYQSGKEELLKPEQYLNRDRNQHLLDPLWLPK